MKYLKLFARKAGRILLLLGLVLLGIVLFHTAINILPLENTHAENKRNEEFFLNFKLSENKLPIFYRDEYNIRLFGIEKFHPFDSEKYGRVVGFLQDSGTYNQVDFMSPYQPDDEVLLKFQDKVYLDSLNSSRELAQTLELFPLLLIPYKLSKLNVLDPMRFAAGGTIMATMSALQRGWAINLGGGFHHASRKAGGGFCAYNDITMAINLAKQKYGLKKILYIDLDAHQGNGPENDFLIDESVFIFDAYNQYIYPQDHDAKKGIDASVKLGFDTDDAYYLLKLEEGLKPAFSKNKFDLVFYNAGTDILEKDELGGMAITREGIIKRDELVFNLAKENKAPIVMVLSGGYQKSNARIIADSILNLKKKEFLK